MKVVHFHFGKDGGAERFFVNLANALKERGIEQKFIIRPGRIWREEISNCGEIIESHYRRVSISQFWLQRKVNQMLRDYKPDAVLSWMPRASRLVPAYPHAIKIARLGDFPKKIDHFKNCDVIIGNVPGIGERCRNLGWNKRVEILSNFPKELSPKPVTRQSMNTPDDAFVISSAGRFVHRKGMDTLIRSVAKLDNAWLWLVGDGKELENLKKLAHQVGLTDRLRFTGWQAEPAPYLAASNIFCMPSRHEPLGNVVLEAWELGLPVVSTRSEGPSWFMRDGENGLMVDIDDVDGLAEALMRLRSEPGLSQHIIKGGTNSIENEFSKKAITDQYINLFSGKPGLLPL